MASDIVIYHELDVELETQVIGRAQRLGRTEPLNVYYLFNENEKVNCKNPTLSLDIFADDITMLEKFLSNSKKNNDKVDLGDEVDTENTEDKPIGQLVDNIAKTAKKKTTTKRKTKKAEADKAEAEAEVVAVKAVKRTKVKAVSKPNPPVQPDPIAAINHTLLEQYGYKVKDPEPVNVPVQPDLTDSEIARQIEQIEKACQQAEPKTEPKTEPNIFIKVEKNILTDLNDMADNDMADSVSSTKSTSSVKLKPIPNVDNIMDYLVKENKFAIVIKQAADDAKQAADDAKQAADDAKQTTKIVKKPLVKQNKAADQTQKIEEAKVNTTTPTVKTTTAKAKTTSTVKTTTAKAKVNVASNQ
jgi:hypothetical protein